MAGCSICKYVNKEKNEFPCCECVHNSKEYFEAKTNADKIRAMTDEELCEIIQCPYEHCIHHDGGCSECTIEWLKSEVKEET